MILIGSTVLMFSNSTGKVYFYICENSFITSLYIQEFTINYRVDNKLAVAVHDIIYWKNYVNSNIIFKNYYVCCACNALRP